MGFCGSLANRYVHEVISRSRQSCAVKCVEVIDFICNMLFAKKMKSTLLCRVEKKGLARCF